ncbi:sortase [Candidatus Dojkabacteria bacterium]|nr:sortase [Candidatus Dojkabacteria bacterium]
MLITNSNQDIVYCYNPSIPKNVKYILMALKTYKKAPVKIHLDRKRAREKEVEIPQESKNRQITLWDIVAGLKNDFTYLMKTSTLARILIPGLLIVTGSFIIYRQMYPEVKQRAREASGYYDATSANLVQGESIQPKEVYLSNPGSEYFRDLTSSAFKKGVLADDPISNDYRGRFNISIPSLELNTLPVQANVESGVEEAYRSVLEGALAHFKDTGLPISDVDNNIVIYGHSAGGDYYSRTRDISAAFSKLSDIKIGDEIEIDMEGQTYNYRVTKTKIVKPDDISIINGTADKETLTLFTCYPNGNDAKRFVAVARPV